jgi:hypothetical protein
MKKVLLVAALLVTSVPMILAQQAGRRSLVLTQAVRTEQQKVMEDCQAVALSTEHLKADRSLVQAEEQQLKTEQARLDRLERLPHLSKPQFQQEQVLKEEASDLKLAVAGNKALYENEVWYRAQCRRNLVKDEAALRSTHDQLSSFLRKG